MPKSHKKKAAAAELPVPKKGDVWRCRGGASAQIVQASPDTIVGCLSDAGDYYHNRVYGVKPIAKSFRARDHRRPGAYDLVELVGSFQVDLPQLKEGQIWQCRCQGIRARVMGLSDDGTGRFVVKLYDEQDDMCDGDDFFFKEINFSSYSVGSFDPDRYDLVNCVYQP